MHLISLDSSSSERPRALRRRLYCSAQSRNCPLRLEAFKAASNESYLVTSQPLPATRFSLVHLSMSAPAKVQSLPYIALQPSLPHVIADITHPRSTVAAENAWVSAYRLPSIPPDQAAKAKEGSVHGRMRVSEADEPGEIEVEGRDGVEVEMRSKVRLLPLERDFAGC